ncbi:hypothetical protein [Paracidovorax wautersii]|uniref:Uncharacterized protein n=1 Tax=Paracidovorax wautersii TaxID=1177982 RepID=A0ABU1I9D9_9BURK|nr:hypothetical protein [Paracidovorax wautersii]MDR6212889.1 hypothetical protein [Paracidovorax wautersii]
MPQRPAQTRPRIERDARLGQQRGAHQEQDEQRHGDVHHRRGAQIGLGPVEQAGAHRAADERAQQGAGSHRRQPLRATCGIEAGVQGAQDQRQLGQFPERDEERPQHAALLRF